MRGRERESRKRERDEEKDGGRLGSTILQRGSSGIITAWIYFNYKL